MSKSTALSSGAFLKKSLTDKVAFVKLTVSFMPVIGQATYKQP